MGPYPEHDHHEENLVELIQGFTELIDKLQDALPASDQKLKLMDKLRDAKREATLAVVDELKR